MKTLASQTWSPGTLGALDHALGEHGTSSLDTHVPAAVWHAALAGPAQEFLARPGKQLRTTMVGIGWTLAGGRDARLAQRLGLIVELLHAGSLVIDDVEDGSTERRGAPALHQMVGVPLAINTGSWMYFWALAEIGALGLAPADELAVYRAASSTLVRCHQGQALDLATRISDVGPTDVPAVVAATTRLKTSTLCAFATSVAARAIGAPQEVIDTTTRLGTSLGTALQMLDDLGSLSPQRREKGREDLRNRRLTWPWAWLVETQPFAWSRFAARVAEAESDAELDAVADALAAETTATGRASIRALIDATSADLGDRPGAEPALATARGLLSHMEKSYG